MQTTENTKTNSEIMSSSVASDSSVMHLYMPKVHVSVANTLKDLLLSANIGSVTNIDIVPRLDNRDRSNCMMAFATIEPKDSKEVWFMKQGIERDGMGRIYYYDNSGNPRYLLATINKTPNKKNEKQQAGTCVMDIIDQQNKKIEELEASLASLRESETA